MRKALYIFAALVLLCAVFVGVLHYNEIKREQQALQTYGDSVSRYSFMYNVDANLVLAVIKAESNFDENAVSRKGAIGLMQILPSTGRFIADNLGIGFSEEQLFESDSNIKFGTYYLSYLSKKFESLETMLAAYNAGEGNVRYWLSAYSDDGKTLNRIPFKETEEYVKKVRFHYERFRKDYNY